MLNAAQYAALSNDMLSNNDDNTNPYWADPSLLGAGTNWLDEMLRTGVKQSYSVSYSGGTEKAHYYVSGGFLDQSGIVESVNYRRFNFQANSDAQVNKWLKFTTNLTFSTDVKEGGSYSIGDAMKALPTQPVKNEDGSWSGPGQEAQWYGSIRNPIGTLHMMTNETKGYNFLANITGEITFTKWLKLKSTFGYDAKFWFADNFTPAYNWKPNPVEESSRYKSDNKSFTYLWDNYFVFDHTFARKHRVGVMAGSSAQWNNYDYLNAQKNIFMFDNIHEMDNGEKMYSLGGSQSDWALLSLMARLNYSYEDKYLLTATVRRDGSSRFGKNNRYGYFPSGSVAWRLSQEDFLKDVKWLSDMKIRASYGITGNNNIGDYASIGIMENANYVLGTGTGNIVNGAAQKSFSNADLTWEKTRQTDLGFEISVLDSRLSLSLDLYYRKTTDLLMDVDIPTITGFEKAMQNIGKMRNKGLEITLSGTPFRGKDFTWDATGNISVNRNKVLALGPTGDPIFSDGGAGTTHVTMVGQPIGAFYGYKMLGIFKTKEELDSYPHLADTQVGDVMFEDVNGDHKIDADDRTIIGNNMPDFTWGMTHSFTFKNFDASISLQGVVGNEVLHLGRRFYTQGEGNQNQLKEMMGRWQSESNPGNGWIPRANSQPTGQNNAISSRWVEDGSFLRVNNLTVGYTLPEAFTKKCSIQRARVYVSTQNLLTITSYSGYNPETSFKEDNVTAPGTDYGMYPLYRTCTFGINVTF